MADNLIPSNYKNLVTDLSALLLQGQQNAINAVNEIRLKTYWQMGERMAKAGELSAGTAPPAPQGSGALRVTADAANSTMAQLAGDLNLEPSLLSRIRQFYQLWPDGVPTVGQANTLSWSHFVELISITDGKIRDFYLQNASEKKWSRDDLRKAIQKDFYGSSLLPKKLKSADKLERPDNPLNVYKAIVEKVVDGDTLLVRIDLGFDVCCDPMLHSLIVQQRNCVFA